MAPKPARLLVLMVLCLGSSAVWLGLPGVAAAQPPVAEAVASVYKDIAPNGALQSPVVQRGEDGYLRMVAVGAQSALSRGTAVSGEAYFDKHGAAFGLTSPRATLEPVVTNAYADRRVERFVQTYAGVPVMGGGATATTWNNGNLVQARGNLLTEYAVLDNGDLPLTPAISVTAARVAARSAVAAAHEGVPVSRLETVREPELKIWYPPMFGMSGPMRLVYETHVQSLTFPQVLEGVLVDAHAGTAVWQWSLKTSQGMLNRVIIDDAGSQLTGAVARVEGQGPTGIEDVDLTYDVLGETYDFFLNEHGFESSQINRDGEIRAVVRLPIFNAFWSPARQEIGIGVPLTTDDVIAHEMVHGVTQANSNLIYFGIPGAINESFSDIWGEFVDLTNGRGDDSDRARWKLGEDIDTRDALLLDPEGTGGIRDMADPPVKGDPDRVGSPLFFNPNFPFDNGGVHINSGILNKMSYLLTDGDTFNGQAVAPFGISTTADLFWGAQRTLFLVATLTDVYFAMSAEAALLGLDFDARLNLTTAAEAVEIFTPPVTGTNFQALPGIDGGGNPVAVLVLTQRGSVRPFSNRFVRNFNAFPAGPEGGELIASTDEFFTVDGNVAPGVEYLYSAFTDSTAGAALRYQVTSVPTDTLVELTEAFGTASPTQQPFDLQFSQITFAPTGPPTSEIIGGNGPIGLNRYETTVRRNVSRLPVPLEVGGDDGAQFLTFLDDQIISVRPTSRRSFPFFGRSFSALEISANGFVSFTDVEGLALENFPSLPAHFSSPRVSFLFSDLAPNRGGTIWTRDMEDSFVVTFSEVPDQRISGNSVPPTSTAQLELFWTGGIRITYQNVSAREAIVGLSDGSGSIFDPVGRIPGVTLNVAQGDFTSAFPDVPQRLVFEPAPFPRVNAGDEVRVDVAALAPPGAGAAPSLVGTSDVIANVPFVDNGDGTGFFQFRADPDFRGIIGLRVEATLGAEQAFQDILVQVGEVVAEPQALDVELAASPDDGGDPAENRVVPTEASLLADYTYFHPQFDLNPDFLDEGDSFLLWRRNNELVSGFTNSPEIPAGATRAGDLWYFSIVPVTVSGIAGEEVFSPVVTIDGAPAITSITPTFGAIEGGEQVVLRGTRLDNIIGINFGGVPVQRFVFSGPDEITVTTPVRTAGLVDITLLTVAGPVRVPSAFTFTAEGPALRQTDVNGDGRVDVTDVQSVVNAVLRDEFGKLELDANGDGRLNAGDIQAVVLDALQG